jgi:hypothetical protein
VAIIIIRHESGGGGLWGKPKRGGGVKEMVLRNEHDQSSLYMCICLYKDAIKKPTKYCLEKGGVKYNRGGEFDQSILYTPNGNIIMKTLCTSNLH